MTPLRHSLVSRAVATARVVARTRMESSIPFRSTGAIERLQRRRLRAIVAHAYETVPFYREAMRDRGLCPDDIRRAQDLARLPLIDSASVRSDPQRFASEAVPPEERETAYSSGTDSALPGETYWDRDYVLRSLITAERDRGVITRLAGEGRLGAFGRELVGPSLRGFRLAAKTARTDSHRRVSLFPNDITTRTMRRVWAEYTLIPARTAHHQFFPPTLPLDEAVARFEALRPRVVFSFGSYADQFLRYLEHAGIELDLPRVWVYGGDMASEETAEIAKRRGCTLYSVYASMETDRLGFHCEQGTGHHLNVDLCAVRIVDESGHDVPAGREGDIVVSNLLNRATVLLNYRIGDRGTLSSTSCACGRGLPLLQELHGRRSDAVRLADGRELPLLVVKGLFRAQLKRTLQAQLVQDGEGRLRWRIVPAPGTDTDALESSFLSRAHEALGAKTHLEVELTPAIERTPRGKFRELVQASASTPSPVPAGRDADAAALVRRGEWGAVAPLEELLPRGPLRAFVLHHTAVPEPALASGGREAEIDYMRRIEHLHLARGWAAIGYHFVIMPSGRVFEGRSPEVLGAHVLGHNNGTVAIALAGNFDEERPAPAALAAIERLRRMLVPVVQTVPLVAHRDLADTECPGGLLYRACVEALGAEPGRTHQPVA